MNDLGNKPTPGRIALIEKLIAEGRPQPPAGWQDDWKVASAYIDEQLAQPSAPTEKQVAFALKIAEHTGQELDPDILAERKALSQWIDAFKDQLPSKKPA